MGKVLKNTFKQSFFSIPFLIGFLFSLGMGIYEVTVFSPDFLLYEESLPKTGVFGYLYFIVAAFCAVSSGREIAAGAVRNMLIAGARKTHIFFSHIIVNLIAAVLFFAAALVPMLIGCHQYFEMFEAYMLLKIFASLLAGYLVIVSITTLFTLMTNNHIAALIVCLCVTFILIYADSIIKSKLMQVRYYSETVSVDGNEKEYVDENFLYVGGTARKLLWTIKSCLPYETVDYSIEYLSEMLTSEKAVKQKLQEFKDNNEDIEYRTERVSQFNYGPIVSAGVFVLLTGFGAFMFKRNNLK